MKYKTFITSIHPKEKDIIFNEFINDLGEKYEIDEVWDEVKWNPPKEYEEEQGGSLITKILILKNPLELEEIIQLKINLMDIEEDFSVNNKRILNLNPGYLSKDGMYLLTHKDSTKRERKKLSEGIWQERQYNFDGEEYKVNENTFSEYSNNERLKLFNSL